MAACFGPRPIPLSTGKANVKLTEGSSREVPLKAIAVCGFANKRPRWPGNGWNTWRRTAESDRIVIRRKAKAEDGGGFANRST